MENIQSGTVLIADPFLKDPNFLRTAIFLCEHNSEEGSFGFVLNRKLDYVIGDLISALDGNNFPVFYGGPVQQNTIHFLHRCPALITGGDEIANGIYWGGEFDEVARLIKNNQLDYTDVRLFLGYSGWSEGQLENEFAEKTWLTTYSSEKLIFSTVVDTIWKDALKQIGGKYEQLIHYPIDPQLN